MNIELFDSAEILEMVKEAGFDKIRCNLTGQVIATIESDLLKSAIGYIRFESPLLDDESILALMATRWLIQSSRPAPHLASFQSHDAHTYLVNNHPKDMFAILIGRMLFEHEKIGNELTASESQRAKLAWLISLQESSEFQAFGPKLKSALDTLIRLDSIHSIRNSLYTTRMRAIVAGVRNEPVTEKMLVALIESVESEGFAVLAKRQYPPVGNRQSLNAALAQAGLLPWQLRIKENEAKQKSASLAFAAKVLESKAKSDLERIKDGISEKQTTLMSELEGQINPLLHARFESALEKEAADKAAAKNPKEKTVRKPKTSASAMKSAARFGDFDFTL